MKLLDQKLLPHTKLQSIATVPLDRINDAARGRDENVFACTSNPVHAWPSQAPPGWLFVHPHEDIEPTDMYPLTEQIYRTREDENKLQPVVAHRTRLMASQSFPRGSRSPEAAQIDLFPAAPPEPFLIEKEPDPKIFFWEELGPRNSKDHPKVALNMWPIIRRLRWTCGHFVEYSAWSTREDSALLLGPFNHCHVCSVVHQTWENRVRVWW